MPVDASSPDEIERLQEKKKDYGPWFILINDGRVIDHGSARPELEQEAMKRKDRGRGQHQNLRVEKIVTRDGEKIDVV